jgi:hypothetical protein
MDMDDCGSAATNEVRLLRELQRRVEDFTAALLLRLALSHNKFYPPLGGRLYGINFQLAFNPTHYHTSSLTKNPLSLAGFLVCAFGSCWDSL